MSLTDRLEESGYNYDRHEMGINSSVQIINESDIHGYSAVIRSSPQNKYTVSISTKLIPSTSSEGEALLQFHDYLESLGTVDIPDKTYEGIGDYIDYTVLVECESETQAVDALTQLVDSFETYIGEVSDFDYIWTSLEEKVREYQTTVDYESLRQLNEFK